MANVTLNPSSNSLNYIQDAVLPEGRITIPFSVQLNSMVQTPVPLPIPNINGDYYLVDTSSIRSVKRISAIKSLFFSATFNPGFQALTGEMNFCPTLRLFVEGSFQQYIFKPQAPLPMDATGITVDPYAMVPTLNCVVPIICQMPSRIWIIASNPPSVVNGRIDFNGNLNNFHMEPFSIWDVL